MFDYREIEKSLVSLPSEILGKTMAMIGSYDPVVRACNQLFVGFASFGPDRSSDLMKAIGLALNVVEFVKFDGCLVYSNILHVAEDCLARFHREYGDSELSIRLADRIIAVAESSAENLQDPSYWDLAVDDIRELKNNFI